VRSDRSQPRQTVHAVHCEATQLAVAAAAITDAIRWDERTCCESWRRSSGSVAVSCLDRRRDSFDEISTDLRRECTSRNLHTHTHTRGQTIGLQPRPHTCKMKYISLNAAKTRKICSVSPQNILQIFHSTRSLATRSVISTQIYQSWKFGECHSSTFSDQSPGNR